MIGVVVPVHNEEACLEACLFALTAACAHPLLGGEPVVVVLVLDDCTDRSAAIATRHAARHRTNGQLTCLTVAARNVGKARHAGAEHLLARDARWLAFTDADTRVAPDWLVAQLALHADAVCGLVTVDDWSLHPPHVPGRFFAQYRRQDDHRHVHGANLGVCSHAYRRAGGFPPQTSHEDVALVQQLMAIDAHIVWSIHPQVITSARPRGRLRGGFADHLAMLATAADAPEPRQAAPCAANHGDDTNAAVA